MIFPDRAENVVGLASLDVIRTKLAVPNPKVLFLWGEDKSNDYRTHPWGRYSTFVTPQSPALIYDDGASICSPVIAFDSLGNALHEHFSLVGELMVAQLFKQEQDILPSPLVSYLSVLPSVLKGENVTVCIGGTNLNEAHLDSGSKVDNVVNYLDKRLKMYYPKAELIALVSKRHPNQLRSNSV